MTTDLLLSLLKQPNHYITISDNKFIHNCDSASCVNCTAFSKDVCVTVEESILSKEQINIIKQEYPEFLI